jgi:hypothetical protein
MRALVSNVAMLSLAAAISNVAVPDAGHAQGVSTPPTFTKQAFDANGAPLTGPPQVGQSINYVLSYSGGTSALGPVTIDDTLSANQTYVNSSIVAPPGWISTLPGYYPGNHETYSNPGFGPGTSFIVNVPVAQLGQSGTSSGDGFYPIPVGGNVYAIFHHETYGSAHINCWNLLSLVQCPGGYPLSLDSSTDPRTTPQIVRTAVFGSRIFFPSAHYDLTSNKTTFGIGCWDTGTQAPCSFIPLPTNPSLSGKYEANLSVGGTALYSVITGVVAEPNNPNRLFMYAIDRVYCVDVSAPLTPIPCSGWSPTILAGSGSQLLDMIVGEGTSPARLYVHYGITPPAGNKTTLACLDASTGNRCAGWTDPQVALHGSPSPGEYGTLSLAFSGAGLMTAVCLHPYLNAVSGDTMNCFDAGNGGAAPNIPNFASAVGSAKVITAYHIPNSNRVLYAQYTNNPPISCFDFAVAGPCTPFAPAWNLIEPNPLNPNMTMPPFQDYGYVVDPAQPDRCLLGLGNKGIIWRFARDGGYDATGCVPRVEQTFDINSFFCGPIKPKQATWNSIVFLNPPLASQLSGGTISVTIGSTTLPVINYVPGTKTYPFNPPVSALGANSQATVLFTPTYLSTPPNGYQLELTFTADVNPQICYQATATCGPVSNNATMAGSIASAAPPVPFKASASLNLGNATGPSCEPGILKVCKVAGTGITVGTPFNFTVSTSASHGVLTVPAGPAPGGTCMVGPGYPIGTQVGVTESVPTGDTVSSITVAPPSQLVNTNLPGGSVTVAIGSGVTEATFTDNRTGFLEICKNGDVTGNFSFTVDPGGLGPFVVPAGACSPAIPVAAGLVTIHEMQTSSSANIIACNTIPAGQQGPCNVPPGSQSSVVTVAPGDISTMTIAFITNRRLRPLTPEPAPPPPAR